MEFRLQLRVEDLVLLYTVARQENISVHELMLRAVREYVQRKASVLSASTEIEAKGEQRK